MHRTFTAFTLLWVLKILLSITRSEAPPAKYCRRLGADWPPTYATQRRASGRPDASCWGDSVEDRAKQPNAFVSLLDEAWWAEQCQQTTRTRTRTSSARGSACCSVTQRLWQTWRRRSADLPCRSSLTATDNARVHSCSEPCYAQTVSYTHLTLPTILLV